MQLGGDRDGQGWRRGQALEGLTMTRREPSPKLLALRAWRAAPLDPAALPCGWEQHCS